MKKILFLFVTLCAFMACDPVSEDIKNGGHITAEELKEMSTVTVNGNEVTCNTTAPVNAAWNIGGKTMLGNYAWKKMKLGEFDVELTGLCADGTIVKATYPIKIETITNPLEKFYIFQPDAPLVVAQGDAAAGRFSDNEGKGLPYLKDDVYFGKKTLIFDVDVEPSEAGIWGEPAGPVMLRLMTGWWDPVFADEVLVEKSGLWELPLTDEIANACAQSAGSRDLDILVRRGTMTIKSIYYEE